MFRRSFAKMASLQNVNPRAIAAEYAVRGKIAIRSGQIEKDLQDPAKASQYPFKQITQCNIGNPQILLQKPLSFPRNVLALMASPELLENPKVGELFNADAIERAKYFISRLGNWRRTGAYTDSKGYLFIRESVAKFIEERDGPALRKVDPEAIYLTNGASSAVTVILNMILGSEKDGLMIPIPQYPLYTALLSLSGATALPYYLDESKEWGVAPEELQRSVTDGKAKGTTPRAMVVINPGNPTGQILTRETMEGMIKLCHQEDMMLLADEVYQDNIYNPKKKFISFRKALLEMGEPYSSSVQLISFHSTSKGRIGECGRRGGYMQLDNIPADVQALILKLSSIQLCANVDGQLMIDLMINPPAGASKAPYDAEMQGLQESLDRRAKLMTEELNKMPGIKSNPTEGAMYVFPTLCLPQKYIDFAMKEKGATAETVDAVWCMEVLEETGIVLVPGSGFGQKPGTLHFRGTILPAEERMQDVVKQLRVFQENLFAKYA